MCNLIATNNQLQCGDLQPLPQARQVVLFFVLLFYQLHQISAMVLKGVIAKNVRIPRIERFYKKGKEAEEDGHFWDR